MEKNNFFEIFGTILLIILLYSYLPTISEISSESGSLDFLWHASNCIFDGINFYSSYLSDDGECPYLMNDGAGYAHGFYLLLYPFTFFEWYTAKILCFLFNIILIVFTIILLCKKFELSSVETYLIIFIIMYSIIVRINLIMGQHTIFTLFFLTLPFVYKSKLSILLSGISYLKYSIGYSLFILFFVSKEYNKIFLSIIPVIIGLLIFCLLTDSNITETIFQPLQLAIHNAKYYGATLTNISLFSFFKDFSLFSENLNYILIGLFTLIFNFFMINKISKKNNNLLKLSSLCLMVLISTPHWGHDYILLIPLLIYSIKNYKFNLVIMRTNILVCIYFLYLYSGVQLYLNNFLSFLNFDILILSKIYPYLDILILLITLFLNLQNKRSEIIKVN
jgi:hypothetical protein